MVLRCHINASERALQHSVVSTCRKMCQLHANGRNLRNPPALSKKKVVSQTKVEEAPPTIIEDTVVWEKELDDLFRTLREPQDEGVSSTQKDPPFPLHTHVSLRKKVSKRGWENVRCSEKNCPIWLPWDRHLNYVLSEVQNKMHPVLRQGFFYCFCREPCKVRLTNQNLEYKIRLPERLKLLDEE